VQTSQKTPLKMMRMTVFLLFSANLAVVLCFLTLQDKHNICTLLENINFICTHCETGQKRHQRLVFLSLSKACTNNLYIFRQCTYVVYIIAVLGMKIWIYWSKWISWIYFYIYHYLKKNYKNYWTWAGGPVLTVRTVMA
jgi:hypothetical protein